MKKTKLADCQVQYDGRDWKNDFSVRSPTGRVVTLNCNGKWNKMSVPLLDMITKYMNAPSDEYTWGDWAPEILSFDMMQEVLDLSGEKK